MSRPFSYNDENFTVIGNILFVHVAIGVDAYQYGQTFCTIPQAIFTRMTTYGQRASVSYKDSVTSSSTISVTCDENGNMILRSDIKKSDTLSRFIYTFYYLKDI